MYMKLQSWETRVRRRGSGGHWAFESQVDLKSFSEAHTVGVEHSLLLEVAVNVPYELSRSQWDAS